MNSSVKENKDNVLLKMSGIYKDFPGVRALKNINFNLMAGEVHVLLGENGAGKSTLIKILTGAQQYSKGKIELYGKEVNFTSPLQAQYSKINAVYQEFNLIPHLDAAHNIFLRKQPLKGKLLPIIDKKKIYSESKKILKTMGVDIDIHVPVKNLSVAYQQIIEIAKALAWESKIIIFDEPTAVITEEESKHLFALINKLKEKGTAIIYISHRLEEISQIGDRITILRDGEYIDTMKIIDNYVDIDSIIKKMVGRELTEQFPKTEKKITEEILRVENLSSHKRFNNISFNLRKGEILGIAGLVGAGRTEIAKAIFGAEPAASGKIFINDKQIEIKTPAAAIRNGVSLIPEDRKNEGLIQLLSIEQNMIMSNQRRFLKNGIFSKKQIKTDCLTKCEEMRIVTNSLEKQVKFLSGGNQQKVVIAKWLLANSKIVIFDEPTRGIDVGAKVEVYNLINQLVKEGVGVIMISSELPEILGMSDRIIVLHEGRIMAELSPENTTQEQILKFASGQGEKIG